MSPGRHGQRAPLLWLLLPFMAGLAAGRIWDASPIFLLALAALMAAAAIPLSASRQPAARRAWPVALALTAGLAGMAYFHLRLNRLSAWETLPAREARLRLQVERTFSPPPEGGEPAASRG